MTDHDHFDLLLTGATILTGRFDRPEIRDGAIGVKDGKISWLGAGVPAVCNAGRTVRLAGHLITPGFVNVHTHAILTMVRGVAADSGFAPSYTPGLPKGTDVNPGQARALARLGALEALMFGSTVLGDHFEHADVATEAMAELGIRLCPSWRIYDLDFSQVPQGRFVHNPAIGAGTLDNAMKLYERWKGHPRVTVNLAAHAVDTCSDGFLREIAALSNRYGLIVSTHLGQSTVEVERVRERSGKTSVEVLDDTGLLNARLMGGHCIYLTESDIARMAKAGAHAVHIPKCNAASGRFAPTHALKRAGINIALATDTQHGDMVELMRWALATARVQIGKVDDEWQPHHVFHMATLGAAKALGMDKDLGSIEIGKRADLVVFDVRRPHLTPLVDPLGNLVHTAQGRDVSMVIVDGEVLVENGRPTRVDMDQVCREAEQAARELWSDVGRRYWADRI
ncbi:MAG: amidohydrolase family protein [Xanthobacteraceae bacterium]|nr:amidohydrolase family protein [Xanthobacteraceae bacterium]